ncbi:MAG: hypothetical protein ACK56F_21070, partial [bacterium]
PLTCYLDDPPSSTFLSSFNSSSCFCDFSLLEPSYSAAPWRCVVGCRGSGDHRRGEGMPLVRGPQA